MEDPESKGYDCMFMYASEVNVIVCKVWLCLKAVRMIMYLKIECSVWVLPLCGYMWGNNSAILHLVGWEVSYTLLVGSLVQSPAPCVPMYV